MGLRRIDGGKPYLSGKVAAARKSKRLQAAKKGKGAKK